MHLLSRTTIGVLFLFIAVILYTLVPSPSVAEYKPEIKGINWTAMDGYTRVVIDLTADAEFSYNRIKNPDRIYIDLHRSVLPPNVEKTLSVGDRFIERVRVSHFTVNTVRVVLDIKKAGKYEVYKLSDPSRVVIDVYDNGGKRAANLNNGPQDIKAGKAV
jgi:N-acetylmuramoyl-L-alanine amidase